MLFITKLIARAGNYNYLKNALDYVTEQTDGMEYSDYSVFLSKTIFQIIDNLITYYRSTDLSNEENLFILTTLIRILNTNIGRAKTSALDPARFGLGDNELTKNLKSHLLSYIFCDSIPENVNKNSFAKLRTYCEDTFILGFNCGGAEGILELIPRISPENQSFYEALFAQLAHTADIGVIFNVYEENGKVDLSVISAILSKIDSFGRPLKTAALLYLNQIQNTLMSKFISFGENTPKADKLKPVLQEYINLILEKVKEFILSKKECDVDDNVVSVLGIPTLLFINRVSSQFAELHSTISTFSEFLSLIEDTTVITDLYEQVGIVKILETPHPIKDYEEHEKSITIDDAEYVLVTFDPKSNIPEGYSFTIDCGGNSITFSSNKIPKNTFLLRDKKISIKTPSMYTASRSFGVRLEVQGVVSKKSEKITILSDFRNLIVQFIKDQLFSKGVSQDNLEELKKNTCLDSWSKLELQKLFSFNTKFAADSSPSFKHLDKENHEYVKKLVNYIHPSPKEPHHLLLSIFLTMVKLNEFEEDFVKIIEQIKSAEPDENLIHTLLSHGIKQVWGEAVKTKRWIRSELIRKDEFTNEIEERCKFAYQLFVTESAPKLTESAGLRKSQQIISRIRSSLLVQRSISRWRNLQKKTNDERLEAVMFDPTVCEAFVNFIHAPFHVKDLIAALNLQGNMAQILLNSINQLDKLLDLNDVNLSESLLMAIPFFNKSEIHSFLQQLNKSNQDLYVSISSSRKNLAKKLFNLTKSTEKSFKNLATIGYISTSNIDDFAFVLDQILTSATEEPENSQIYYDLARVIVRVFIHNGQPKFLPSVVESLIKNISSSYDETKYYVSLSLFYLTLVAVADSTSTVTDDINTTLLSIATRDTDVSNRIKRICLRILRLTLSDYSKFNQDIVKSLLKIVTSSIVLHPTRKDNISTGVTSEAIVLIRILFKNPTFNSIATEIFTSTILSLKDLLQKEIRDIRESESDDENCINEIKLSTATFSILGGYIDDLYEGGKIQVEGEQQDGTLVEYSKLNPIAKVLLKNASEITEFDTNLLFPRAEEQFNPALFTLTPDLIASINYILFESLPKIFWVEQLKVTSTRGLIVLLYNKQSLANFLSSKESIIDDLFSHSFAPTVSAQRKLEKKYLKLTYNSTNDVKTIDRLPSEFIRAMPDHYPTYLDEGSVVSNSEYVLKGNHLISKESISIRTDYPIPPNSSIFIWEIEMENSHDEIKIGLISGNGTYEPGSKPGSVGIKANGDVCLNGIECLPTKEFSSEVIGLVYYPIYGELYFFKSGVLISIIENVYGGPFYPAISSKEEIDVTFRFSRELQHADAYYEILEEYTDNWHETFFPKPKEEKDKEKKDKEKKKKGKKGEDEEEFAMGLFGDSSDVENEKEGDEEKVEDSKDAVEEGEEEEGEEDEGEEEEGEEDEGEEEEGEEEEEEEGEGDEENVEIGEEDLEEGDNGEEGDDEAGAYDEGPDGYINIEEEEAAAAEKKKEREKQSEEKVAKLQEAFLKLDVDSTGLIELDKINEFLESAGYPTSQEKIDLATGALDPDFQNRVSFEEFLTFLISMEDLEETPDDGEGEEGEEEGEGEEDVDAGGITVCAKVLGLGTGIPLDETISVNTHLSIKNIKTGERYTIIPGTTSTGSDWIQNYRKKHYVTGILVKLEENTATLYVNDPENNISENIEVNVHVLFKSTSTESYNYTDDVFSDTVNCLRTHYLRKLLVVATNSSLDIAKSLFTEKDNLEKFTSMAIVEYVKPSLAVLQGDNRTSPHIYASLNEFLSILKKLFTSEADVTPDSATIRQKLYQLCLSKFKYAAYKPDEAKRIIIEKATENLDTPQLLQSFTSSDYQMVVTISGESLLTSEQEIVGYVNSKLVYKYPKDSIFVVPEFSKVEIFIQKKDESTDFKEYDELEDAIEDKDKLNVASDDEEGENSLAGSLFGSDSEEEKEKEDDEEKKGENDEEKKEGESEVEKKEDEEKVEEEKKEDEEKKDENIEEKKDGENEVEKKEDEKVEEKKEVEEEKKEAEEVKAEEKVEVVEEKKEIVENKEDAEEKKDDQDKVEEEKKDGESEVEKKEDEEKKDGEEEKKDENVEEKKDGESEVEKKEDEEKVEEEKKEGDEEKSEEEEKDEENKFQLKISPFGAFDANIEFGWWIYNLFKEENGELYVKLVTELWNDFLALFEKNILGRTSLILYQLFADFIDVFPRITENIPDLIKTEKVLSTSESTRCSFESNSENVSLQYQGICELFSQISQMRRERKLKKKKAAQESFRDITAITDLLYKTRNHQIPGLDAQTVYASYRKEEIISINIFDFEKPITIPIDPKYECGDLIYLRKSADARMIPWMDIDITFLSEAIDAQAPIHIPKAEVVPNTFDQIEDVTSIIFTGVCETSNNDYCQNCYNSMYFPDDTLYRVCFLFINLN